ncbi:hypothetical protein MMPV_000558 [Pyropia vietnamensis]
MPIHVSVGAAKTTATLTPPTTITVTNSRTDVHTLILTPAVSTTATDATDADAPWSASRKVSPDGMMRMSLAGKTRGDGCGGASPTAVAVAATVDAAVVDDDSGVGGSGGRDSVGSGDAAASPLPSPVTDWCVQPPRQPLSDGLPYRSLALSVGDKGSNGDCDNGAGADGAVATATPTETPAVVAAAATTPPLPPPTAVAWAAATPYCLTRRYTLTGVLSTSGLSPVLAATDRATGATVAVKVLTKNTQCAATPAGRSALAREVAVLRSLSPHPAIVGYVDVAEDSTAVYLVTEALLGGDLLAAVRRRPFGLRAALRVALQLLEGLAACHAVGVAHRDVKLANVVVSRTGAQVKLVDFGLCHWRRVPLAAALPRRPSPATAAEGGVSSDGFGGGGGGTFDAVWQRTPQPPPGTFPFPSGTPRTAAAVRTPVGTPGYVCPEIVDGRPYIPEEADVYGVGVVLYALVARGMPPSGLRGEVPRPSGLGGGRRRYVHPLRSAAAPPPSTPTTTATGSPTGPPPPPSPPPAPPPPQPPLPPPPPSTTPPRPSLSPVPLSGRWATAHPQVVALLRALLAPRGLDRPTAAAAAVWVNALLRDPPGGGGGGCGDRSLRHANHYRRHRGRRSTPVAGQPAA